MTRSLVSINSLQRASMQMLRKGFEAEHITDALAAMSSHCVLTLAPLLVYEAHCGGECISIRFAQIAGLFVLN